MNLTSFIFTAASLGTNGIKLINEYDGWSFFSCKLECITNHLSSITDEHLDKLRSGKFEEGGFSLGSASTSHHSFSCTWRSMHEEALRRSNSDGIKSILVSHGKDDGFDEFLNLFIQATNISVFFSRSLIDFHRFNTRIILRRQFLIDNKALFVDSNKFTRLELFRLNHADYRKINCVSTRGLYNERLLLFAHIGLLESVALILIILNIENLANICNHMRQLSRHI